jgi:hypothetical protein
VPSASASVTPRTTPDKLAIPDPCVAVATAQGDLLSVDGALDEQP